jgi:hypothetical protein
MPGEFYIEGKKEKIDISGLVAAAIELEDKLDSIVVYRGRTTADGAADGSTLICADLTTKPDYDGNLIVVKSGACAGQASEINGSTTGGAVTAFSPFGGQVTSGVKIAILSLRVNMADITAIVNILNAVKAQTDKLAGVPPFSDSVKANWQSGTGTSGETGADLVTVGAHGSNYKLHSLEISMRHLTVTATITVKLFTKVDGEIYGQEFVVGTDPAHLWIVNGTVGIHESLRVEIQSDNALDNGKEIRFDFMLEMM